MAKKDLLSLNFEGILKYFRVQLPKRYRNEVAARQLMKLTSSFKLKKLKKYEKEWLAIKVLSPLLPRGLRMSDAIPQHNNSLTFTAGTRASSRGSGGSLGKREQAFTRRQLEAGA
jgi:hypothetical protein